MAVSLEEGWFIFIRNNFFSIDLKEYRRARRESIYPATSVIRNRSRGAVSTRSAANLRRDQRNPTRRYCIKINECNLKTGRHTPVLGPRSESRSYLGYSSCLIDKQFRHFSSSKRYCGVNNIIQENKDEFRFQVVTMFGLKERMK